MPRVGRPYVGSEPNSPAEWLSLARQNARAARVLSEDKLTTSQSWDHVGFAIEHALKAVIMHTHRLNAWPSKSSRPDLHTHSLRILADLACITVSAADPIAPAWKTILDWERGHS